MKFVKVSQMCKVISVSVIINISKFLKYGTEADLRGLYLFVKMRELLTVFLLSLDCSVILLKRQQMHVWFSYCKSQAPKKILLHFHHYCSITLGISISQLLCFNYYFKQQYIVKTALSDFISPFFFRNICASNIKTDKQMD